MLLIRKRLLKPVIFAIVFSIGFCFGLSAQIPVSVQESNVYCLTGFPICCTLMELSQALNENIKGTISWEATENNGVILRIVTNDPMTQTKVETVYLFETSPKQSVITRVIYNGQEIIASRIPDFVVNGIGTCVQIYKAKQSEPKSAADL